MAAADRDLLFGLLALQNGLIDQAALVAAFHAWTRDKSRPLADHHAALGHLDADGRAAVEAMVALHLKKHGGDAERSLAAVGGVGSLRDDLQHIADPELHATLDRIVADGPATARDPEATMTVGVAPAAAAGSRFSILRPHARGGLGQVSVARDAELNREVALKELRPERADDPSSRARFLLEAEVTGRLEHPGVVPVYGLGCDARGRPFYAMRLVKGETLKEAIEHFHAPQAAAGGDVRPWNLALRQLLSRFVAVCNVVAYAHSRGVIHRDLKPANILLGPFAETLVVDWGLAKVVGRDEAARSVAAAEATLQPASGSGSSETLPGTALGTPAYMSPEQAEGRLERTGPASDVYSLGATLYSLLTGRPPLEETDVAAVLRKIQRGEIVPPRRVNGRVPAGLEAICRKAMAVDPGDRYPTPRALADEIEHWLADEPVSVHREPLSTRLTRWGRRHRTLATGLGVLLITAVAGLSIATAMIRREREDLRRKDYINRVNLAHREVLDDNIARAADLLEGCPVDLRNWEWRYVRRLCHLERLTYRGHFENVRCLAISPDRTWVASGAYGPWSVADDPSEVRIWDLQTGRERHVFPDLPGTVQAVAFSPDGTRVAAGGGFYNPRAGGWLKVWDAASGKLVWETPVPGTTVMTLAFHPKGLSLAVGYGLYSDMKHAGHVQLHRVTDGAPLEGPFGKMIGGVNTVAFDADGRRLALAGLGRIELWDVETRALIRSLTGHTRWVYCVAFSPDGEHLASGGWDNTIKLWDCSTGAEIRTIPGHRGFVEGIAFSPDGTQLASGSEDNSVQLWEVPTGRPLAAFHGHTDRVHALAFHPDGRHILSGGVDGTVKVWDVFTSRSVIFRGHSDLVRSVEFLDNDHVVSRDKDYSPLSSPSTKVWHVATGEEVRPPPPRAHDGPGGITDPQAQGRSLSRLSPDGTLFAQVKYGPGLEVEVRRPSDGRLAFTLQGHTSQVSDVVFSPDGTRIATASFDGTVKLWDAATGQEVLTLRGHTVGVLCVAFSPDGTKLVSGGHDTLAIVWDATRLSEAVPTEARAHRLVQSRLAECPRKDELSEQLRTDAGLDEPTRAAALRIAVHLPDPPPPRRLLDASWNVARSPGRDPRDYQRALRWAEEGSRRLSAPDGFILTVLGTAYYRAGRFQDARDALDRAEPLLDAVGSWPPPALFVPIHHIFRAMTLHRLGRRDEARSQLGRLRRECQERPGEYFLSRVLLGEAEALIDPQAAGPPTGARPSRRDGSP